MSELRDKLEKFRKDLLDLGLKNNFINSKDSKTKSLSVVGENSKEVIKKLVDQSSPMSFNAKVEKIDSKKDYSILLPSKQNFISAGVGSKQSSTRSSYLSTPLKSKENKRLKSNNSSLNTSHTEKDLEKRLKSISKLFQSSIEEKGVNILYLALGFIKWYESDNSNKPYFAPIILVPVEITRKSINSEFKINYNDDDIGSNISFFEKLKMEFGIKIEIPDEINSSTITEIFEKIESSINIKRWEILKNEIRLGLFSFFKFLMFNDLNEENWDDNSKPYNHPLLSKFIGEGFNTGSENSFSEYSYKDDVSYEKIYNVLPADSSQQEVIFSVRGGLNTIVQGPPGTGKSQTITNVIVDFLSRDKKVLFVAEKLDALKVVSNRLKSLGLDSLGLEIHSNKANKNQFLSELSKVITSTKPTINIDQQAELSKGDSLRELINDYSSAVNSKFENTGFTPIECFGEVIKNSNEIKEELYDIDMNLIKDQSKENFNKYLDLVKNTYNQFKKTGSIKSNPYRLIKPTNYELYQCEIFIKKSEKYYNELSKIITKINDELSELKISDFTPSLNNIDKLFKTFNQLNILTKDHDKVDFKVIDNYGLEKLKFFKDKSQKYAELLNRYKDLDNKVESRFWKEDCFVDYKNYLIDYKKFYKFFISRYRKTKSYIRKYLKSAESPVKDDLVIGLMSTNVEYSEFLDEIGALNKDFKKFSNSDYSTINSNWDELKNSIDWFINYKKKIEENQVFDVGFDFDWIFIKPRTLKIDLSKLRLKVSEIESFLKSANVNPEYDINNESLYDIAKLFKSWVDNRGIFNDYIQLIKNIDTFKSYGLDWLQEILENWDYSHIHCTKIFRYYWFKSIANKALKNTDVLGRFNGINHSEKVKDYCYFEDILLKINIYRVLYKHWNTIPNSRHSSGRLGILKKELSKKRKLKPIRKLISECGDVILDLKPLFLMSPMTVAQFIETNSIEFDLVIFDEASQIKPVEAFGSILRAKQVVIVGDSKQLPPTPFFDSLSDDEYDEEEEEDFSTSDVESILALSQGRNMDEKMLRWHYRSKHQSLIEVSNIEFYNSNLLVFPSPFNNSEDFGLKHFHTEGTFYSPGIKGGSVNREEAKLIVKQIIKHAVERPDKSLGVVAFSNAQAKIIEDYLEQEIKINQNLKAEEYVYDNSKDEKFFVKSIESVQGDERDYIFISVGYGFQENGKLSYNLGPINKEGGERRLNVLFSRSKSKCVVFSNFKGDHIDESKTDSKGIRILKTYLIFAERGQVQRPKPTGGSADSIFEEQVASVLLDNRIDIELQVGSQGYKIDICVKHPFEKGRYVLAIECDGASYHSSKTARDRDKSRQSILESMGWKFYRIWSTDWFFNKERESRKLVEHVRNVLNDSHLTENTLSEKKKIEISYEGLSNHINENHLAYKKYNKSYTLKYDIYEYDDLDKLILEIIEVEQPIHKDVILSRVLEVTGKRQYGRRIKDFFNYNLNICLKYSNKTKVYKDQDFYCIDQKFKTPSIDGIIRYDRTNLSRRESNFQYISIYEIKSVILSFVKSSYGIELEDLINEVPKVFGFRRFNEKYRDIVRNNTYQLIEGGFIKNDDNILYIKDKKT